MFHALLPYTKYGLMWLGDIQSYMGQNFCPAVCFSIITPVFPNIFLFSWRNSADIFTPPPHFDFNQILNSSNICKLSQFYLILLNKQQVLLHHFSVVGGWRNQWRSKGVPVTRAEPSEGRHFVDKKLIFGRCLKVLTLLSYF